MKQWSRKNCSRISRINFRLILDWLILGLILDSLKPRCWSRKLCHFYKILNEKSPSYLFDLIPNLNRVHETRHSNNIPAIHTRHNYFITSFFPFTISEWNNLDCKIRNSGNLSIFKKNLLNFIRLITLCK